MAQRIFATICDTDGKPVATAGQAKTSVLYDGGDSTALQLEADSSEVVAGGADVIDMDGASVLDVQIVNAAAGESLTLLVSEFSAATPTIGTQIRQTEIEIPTADLVVETDLEMVGLSTAAGYAKQPIRLAITPGAYVMLSLAAESAGNAKYARYQLM